MQPRNGFAAAGDVAGMVRRAPVDLISEAKNQVAEHAVDLVSQLTRRGRKEGWGRAVSPAGAGRGRSHQVGGPAPSN